MGSTHKPKPGAPIYIVIVLVIFILLLIAAVGFLWFQFQDCRKGLAEGSTCPTVIPN